MKQTVIDILIYLFEHYVDDDIELDLERDRLKSEPREAGFDAAQVGKAFDWMQDLAGRRDETGCAAAAALTSTRIYTLDEQRKLDGECRGFLHFLEQSGVLDGPARELVVERALALESEELDVDQLKWIVLMVLFNQPGHEGAFAWLEDFVMDDALRYLH